MTTIARAVPETRRAPTAFDRAAIERVRVDRSAAERRAATLLRAVTCLDLTTLAGDDTPGTVRRLCAKARQPLRQDLVEALGASALGVRVGAVCVYPALVPVAVEALAGSGVPVASVAAGFPAGQTSLRLKVEEVLGAVRDGAREIDIVISRAHVLTGNWRALYDEVRELKQAAGEARLKVILATGELGTLTNVARASVAALQAGADFIKTSTGKESVNATLPVGLVMVRAIREHFERTGQRAGFKPAGGIRTAKAALDWLILIKEELGDAWLNAERFRIGASGLLTDIERQLSHFVTGRYSAAHDHPMV
jgi:deoxyribose-phosphate aldolase